MSEAVIFASHGTRKWPVHFFLAVCCLLSVSQAAIARGCASSRSRCEAQTEDASAAIPDSPFAIGDFDGDRRLDRATVEIARFNALHSRYSVSFRLSKGRLQTIGVTGPAGGLVLIARDVNGDRALDLVLVTAWRHELVAVFLNDGEGNFAATDPTQFRINALPSRLQIRITPGRTEDRTVLSFQHAVPGEPGHKLALTGESGAVVSRALDFAVTLFPSSLLARAPPRSFLYV
jgi:hypothetical protein